MKSRSIIANGWQVRAIQAGLKTQFRRPVEDPPDGPGKFIESQKWTDSSFHATTPDDHWAYFHQGAQWIGRCPYGQVGDQLWVREEYRKEPFGQIAYHADLPNCNKLVQWRSPILMPRKLSRTTLAVEEVRIERLHDISHDDLGAMGCDDLVQAWDAAYANTRACGRPITHYVAYPWHRHFATGHHSTYDHRGKPWHIYPNPWVWVLTFSVLPVPSN